MKNKILITSVIVLIFTVILGFSLNMFIKLNSPKTEVLSSSVMKDAFVSECISVDATYAYCSCAYDKLEKDLGKEGFIKMAMKYNETGEMPDGVIAIVSSCFELLK